MWQSHESQFWLFWTDSKVWIWRRPYEIINPSHQQSIQQASGNFIMMCGVFTSISITKGEKGNKESRWQSQCSNASRCQRLCSHDMGWICWFAWIYHWPMTSCQELVWREFRRFQGIWLLHLSDISSIKHLLNAMSKILNYKYQWTDIKMVWINISLGFFQTFVESILFQVQIRCCTSGSKFSVIILVIPKYYTARRDSKF